jgi:rhodanese-related sulfurtransferase
MLARLFGRFGSSSITPRRLHETLRDGQVTVVDVNSHESWMEAHVPGAVNLDPEGYDESQLPEDRDATVIFYCSNSLCRKAPNAARRARERGYGNVVVMSAGIRGWVSSALPVERG